MAKLELPSDKIDKTRELRDSVTKLLNLVKLLRLLGISRSEAYFIRQSARVFNFHSRFRLGILRDDHE